mmetsp:Transcript_11840/g.17650  ORF Transcript_11840/g.17650 Transcript_11840/m.17650 type:complete len:180 (+) Transcript_11840:279-818(+)
MIQAQQNPVPFFTGEYQNAIYERNNRDDTVEVRNCRARIMELESRCHNLEQINADLERRLEKQAQEQLDFDKEFSNCNRSWQEKLNEKNIRIEEWKEKYLSETKLADAAREKLRRTEMELYRILSKKYDIIRESKQGERAVARDRDRISRDLETEAYAMSSFSVREKSVTKSLSDFFCL